MPNAFHKQLVDLGLPLKESGDYYGYSLALGSAEVSLLALTNAYRALANGGRTSATTLMLGAKPAMRAALDPRAAFIVGDILSDPLARARTFGTDSILATRFWSAVKTGTSKDMRDNWALGYSQDYTVGVWVGNAFNCRNILMTFHAHLIIDIAGLSLTKTDKQRLKHPLVGGLILFARNWQDRAQLTQLCR